VDNFFLQLSYQGHTDLGTKTSTAQKPRHQRGGAELIPHTCLYKFVVCNGEWRSATRGAIDLVSM